MSMCYKFTCGVVVIAIIIALVVVGLAYKAFGEPYEDEETGETVHFWDVEVNRCYLIILGLFVCSLAVNIIGHKLPFIGLIVSFVPLWYCIKMFDENLLVKKPQYFIVIGAINVIGCIIAFAQYINIRRGLPADGDDTCEPEDSLPDWEPDDEIEDGIDGKCL